MAVQAGPIINWGGDAPQSIAVQTDTDEVEIVFIETSYTVLAAPAVFQLAQLSAGHAI
jgi:hypothetical protein